MNKFRFIMGLLVVCAYGFSPVYAQDLVLHQMSFVGQRQSLNPALLPEMKWYLGVNGGAMYGNSGFNINDIISSGANSGSGVFSPSRAASKLSADNGMRLDGIGDFSFGFRMNPKWYFHSSFSAKANLRLDYPPDLFQFLFLGNARDEVLDKDMDIAGFKVTSNVYGDATFGLTYQPNCTWTVGMGLKYLQGLAHISTVKSYGIVNTSSEFYQWRITNDFEFRTNMQVDLDGDRWSIDFQNDALFKNHGLGLNLGATYRLLNKKLLLSASIIDMGFISWNSGGNTRIYNQSENRDFMFSGLTTAAFNNTDAAFEEIIDTLTTLFDVKTERTGAYATSLTSRFYLGGDYQFHPSLHAGVLAYGEIVNNRLRLAWSNYASVNVSKILQLQGSLSFMNRSISNVGLGMAVNMGPVQWWLVSDNLSILFNPFMTRTLHARTGVNIVFGYFKDKSNPCSKYYKNAPPPPQTTETPDK